MPVTDLAEVDTFQARKLGNDATLSEQLVFIRRSLHHLEIKLRCIEDKVDQFVEGFADSEADPDNEEG